MRNFLLLITFLMVVTMASAQTAVVVNSPASIAGAKAFDEAGTGFSTVALSSGTWTADAIFVDNGTATPTIGCVSLINGSELAGKIALIDRGSCNFSEKVSLAENAGAIAAIVFNNLPGDGTFAMGLTAPVVNIPAVMLSFEDGQAIRAELANGPVNITMGAIVFDNNVSVDITRILNPLFGTVPKYAVGNGQFEVPTGASVLNRGLNDAENVVVQASIDHNGSQVYSEEGTVEVIVTGDTSDLEILPAYEPPAETGYYDLTYDVTYDTPDESSFDNSVSTSFYISENTFCKGRWDEANNRPEVTIGYTRDGGGNVMFMSGFHMTNATGAVLDSATFYVSTTLDSFGLLSAGSFVSVYAFLWEDLNQDSMFSSDEFTTVAFNTVDLDPSLDRQWVTVNLLDFISFNGPYTFDQDEVNLIIAPRFEGTETVFFGFDEGIDQTQRNDNNLFTSDLDIPYLQTNTWDPDSGAPGSFGVFNNGMGGTTMGSVATAVHITPAGANAVQEPLLEDVSVNIYPNPATNRFTTEVALPGVSKYLEYSIRDASGRQLFRAKKDNVQNDKVEFNISALPTGQYFLMVRTENGVATYPVSVQR
ncbi:MAG: PA domain-containing protein [Saprospiraceae bacterium]